MFFKSQSIIAKEKHKQDADDFLNNLLAQNPLDRVK